MKLANEPTNAERKLADKIVDEVLILNALASDIGNSELVKARYRDRIAPILAAHRPDESDTRALAKALILAQAALKDADDFSRRVGGPTGIYQQSLKDMIDAALAAHAAATR